MTTTKPFDPFMLAQLSADTGLSMPTLVAMIDDARNKTGATTDEAQEFIRSRLVGPASASPKPGG